MGYNDKVIESGFSKASEINRNDLLEYKEKKINKRVPLKKNKRFRPFCLCLPDVMFVTRGSKNSRK
jgi:hypothetical protein